MGIVYSSYEDIPIQTQNRQYKLKKDLKFAWNGEHYILDMKKGYRVVFSGSRVTLYKLLRHPTGKMYALGILNNDPSMYDISECFETLLPLKSDSRYIRPYGDDDLYIKYGKYLN